MISIICPNYNDSKSVINNIRKLSKSNMIYEIIVVDDGSEDFETLLQFNSTSVRVLRNKSENSAGTCRNIGLSLAKYEWIVFLDSDDDICLDSLSVIIDESLKTHCIPPDIIFSKPTSIKESGDYSKRHLSYCKLIDLYLNNSIDDLRFWFHVPWAKIFHASYLKRINAKFSDTIVSNDVEFSLITGVNAKNIYVTDRSYYRVLEREGSLTKVNNYDRLRVRRDVIIRYNNILEKFGRKKYQIPLMKIDYHLFRLKKSSNEIFQDIFKAQFYPSLYYLLAKLLRRN